MDLSQIPQQLLEKIVTKLEWRSYFRMQQTCRDMADFFRTSRNVRVHLPKNISLHIGAGLLGSPQYYLSTNKSDRVSTYKMDESHASLESLYGACFGFIKFRDGRPTIPTNRNFLMDCCEILRKYRITSRKVNALKIPAAGQYDDKEYEELLKNLKPIRVRLISEGSNRWEVLLKAKQLKVLYISTLVDDILDLRMIKSLLEKCPELEIEAHMENIQVFYGLANKILEYLRSEELPNLRSFIIRGIDKTMTTLTTRRLKKLFPKYKLNNKGWTGGTFSKSTFDCQMGLPEGRACELSLVNCRRTFFTGLEIHFRDTDIDH